jgi:hypothetical protein
VEGESGAVPGVCELGWGNGGWCYGVSVEVCCAGHCVAGTLDGCCECVGECGGYDEVSVNGRGKPVVLRMFANLWDYSSVVLWISQNMEDEYSYNLAL